MILTSNRGFAEWGDIFGDSVVATALLDRLLHHAVVIQIEGSSYRPREHADLLSETVRSKPHAAANPIPPTFKRRGRPPTYGGADQRPRLIANPPDWGNLRRHFCENRGAIDRCDASAGPTSSASFPTTRRSSGSSGLSSSNGTTNGPSSAPGT